MSFFPKSSSMATALLLTTSVAFADTQAGIAALENNDVETAAKEFQASLDAGDGDGAFYLGRMFELGLGTEVNIQQAILLYKVSAEQESALGMNRLGLMFLDGQTVIKDFQRGSELVCKAADKGEANAQFNCGAAYSEGKGLPKDTTKAPDY